MTSFSTRTIDSDIALFLGDAGSSHQAFSKQVLCEYLAAEGHNEEEVREALAKWSPVWISDSSVEDEFHLNSEAWARVARLQPLIEVPAI